MIQATTVADHGITTPYLHLAQDEPETPEQEAWAAYWRDRTTENRKRVATHYLPLVKQVAAKVARSETLGKYQDHDDLVSMGTIGLLDAIERYKPSVGYFKPFACPRIRGKILDTLRDLNWVPRVTAARHQKAKAFREAMLKQTGNRATDEEAIHQLDIPNCRTSRYLEVTAPLVCTTPFTKKHRYETSGPDLNCPESNLSSPHDAVADADLVEHLTASMNRQQKLVFSLRFQTGMKMKDVGKAAGVTESRASQVVAEIRRIIERHATQGERLKESA